MNVCLTFDVDWAQDELIEDTLNLLIKYDVKATFFSTHNTLIFNQIDKTYFEIGIHSNFNDILNGNNLNFKRSIDELISYYPHCKGVRSHSLVDGTQILNYFAEVGLIYDSNILVPFNPKISPFYYFNGLLRIPYFWGDDIHLIYKKHYTLDEIPLSNSTFNILTFHPIHIFLNTENIERYKAAKKYYKNPKKLLEYGNKSKKGTRNLLILLLEYIKFNNIKTNTLNEITELFKKNQSCE